jgi:hypothetical protein
MLLDDPMQVDAIRDEPEKATASDRRKRGE